MGLFLAQEIELIYSTICVFQNAYSQSVFRAFWVLIDEAQMFQSDEKAVDGALVYTERVHQFGKGQFPCLFEGIENPNGTDNSCQ